MDKLHGATQRGVNVIHCEKIIQWNIDKRYLVELSNAGHKVVPTYLEDDFGPGVLEQYFDRHKTLVLKPRVGAGGRDTFKISRAEAEMVDSLFGRSVLVQPFVPEIEETGEHSFVFFEEKFSHAVLKRAKTGEFRVQDGYGGTVEAYVPSRPEIEAVTGMLKSVGLDTVYARVDVVRRSGEFYLMELEIFEPELFFRFSNNGMSRFAQAVRKRLIQ